MHELLNRIATGDCRELAKRIPDESVDFAFADPPYWVGYDYGNRTDADMDFINPYWLVKELQRVAPIVCVTPGNSNVHKYPSAEWIIAWSKPASSGRNWSGGYAIWEPILVYRKPRKRIWQDVIEARGGREHAGAFNGCPKPEKLLRWLIEQFTEPDDIVLDPMVGSGTTAVACKQLGRNYIAFEIDPETAEKARERVRNTPEPLFVLEPQQMELAHV